MARMGKKGATRTRSGREAIQQLELGIPESVSNRQDVVALEGWARATLSELAEVRLGRQRSPSRAVGDHMCPYMRAANVTWTGISLDDVKEMDFRPDEVKLYRLEDGDILLAEASGSASEVGKPAIWRNEIPGACFQNTLIRVRAPRELVRFLHLHFVHDALTGKFAQASRGVGIHHLGAKTLSDWKVLIPAKEERQKICDTVDELFTKLDAATAGLRRTQANLKRYRASVLKAAVEGRLVPTEAELAKQEGRTYEPASVLLERILKERRRRWEEAELAKMKAKGKAPKDDGWKARYEEPAGPVTTKDLFELPEGWACATVVQLAEYVEYGTSAKSSADDSGIPVLRMGNIIDGQLVLQDLKYLPQEHAEFPTLLLHAGDMLFNRTNSPELVGKSAVFRGTPSPCSFASYLIRARFPVEIEPEYVSAFLNSPYGRDWTAKVRSQQVGQANINGSKLKACIIPLPPFTEQRRIVEEMERLLSVAGEALKDTRHNETRIARLRQSILKSAFEGKLVDQDPNDEPASALLARLRAERNREAHPPTPTPSAPRPRRSSKKPVRKTKRPPSP